MNPIQKILCILFIFGLVIIITSIHSIVKKRKIRTEEKLKEDAKRYFVTICHKILTPFGDEKSSNDFIRFSIIENYLFVYHITRRYGSRNNLKIIMTAQFKGNVLIEKGKEDKEYSYGAFECYLSRFLGDSLVYDFYIQHLWNEMKKEETVE